MERRAHEAAIDLSVVVPTFRSRESLPELVSRLESFFDAANLQGETILVNDASPDGTWEVITGLCETHSSLVGIDLLSNHGQARATLCGIAHARGELVATMDDDLQQPPESLGVVLDAIESDNDLDAVIGSWRRDHQRAIKKVGSLIHEFTDRYAHGTPPGFRHSSLRVMRRPLVEALVNHETRTPVLGPLIIQLSDHVVNVEVDHVPRPYGKSTISLRESVHRVTTNFIHGTTLPLQLLAQLGVLAAVASLVVAGVLAVRWAAGVETPPGWASVFVATLFFGGAILIGIAIIGRYMSVILEETRGRPRWVVRRTSGAGEDPIGPDTENV